LACSAVVSNRVPTTFRLGSCIGASVGSIVGQRGCMKLRQVAKRFLVAASFFALLTANVPGLAESLSASNLSTCCNSTYCPMHHYEAREQQTDKSNCHSHYNSAGNDSSMRACDTTTSALVGTAPFVLITPHTKRVPMRAEPTQMQATRFFPFVINIPLTPPPRILPS
jgi:hypothetical protein